MRLEGSTARNQALAERVYDGIAQVIGGVDDIMIDDKPAPAFHAVGAGRTGGRELMTVERAGGHPSGQPTLPAKPIRDMTVKELVAVIRYLEAAPVQDEVLVRALRAELTEQAGVGPGQTSGALEDPCPA